MPRQGQGAERTARRNGGDFPLRTSPAPPPTRGEGRSLAAGARPRSGWCASLPAEPRRTARSRGELPGARGDGSAREKPPAPEKSPSSGVLRVPLKAEGRVRDVTLAERPEAGRAVQPARSLAARGPPGVFDRWFPLFPISHMQISAPAPESAALEGKCGSAGARVRL